MQYGARRARFIVQQLGRGCCWAGRRSRRAAGRSCPDKWCRESKVQNQWRGATSGCTLPQPPSTHCHAPAAVRRCFRRGRRPPAAPCRRPPRGSRWPCIMVGHTWGMGDACSDVMTAVSCPGLAPPPSRTQVALHGGRAGGEQALCHADQSLAPSAFAPPISRTQAALQVRQTQGEGAMQAEMW